MSIVVNFSWPGPLKSRENDRVEGGLGVPLDHHEIQDGSVLTRQVDVRRH